MVHNPGYRDSADLFALRDNYVFAKKALEEIATREFVSFSGHCRDREKELMGIIKKDNADADTGEILRLFEDALVDIEADARTIEDALTGIGFSKHEVGYPPQVLYSRPSYEGAIDIFTDHDLYDAHRWNRHRGLLQLYRIPEQDVEEWYKGLPDYIEKFLSGQNKMVGLMMAGVLVGSAIMIGGVFLGGIEYGEYLLSASGVIAGGGVANLLYFTARHGDYPLSRVNKTRMRIDEDRNTILTEIAQPSKQLKKQFDGLEEWESAVKARVDVDVEGLHEEPNLLQEEKKLKARTASSG